MAQVIRMQDLSTRGCMVDLCQSGVLIDVCRSLNRQRRNFQLRRKRQWERLVLATRTSEHRTLRLPIACLKLQSSANCSGVLMEVDVCALF